MLTTLDGRSPVDAFVAGDLDVTSIGFLDAGWIAYDRELGPVAAQRPVAVGHLLRLRHAPRPVRRRARPPGVRPGGGLAAARGARRAGLVRPGDEPRARPGCRAGPTATTCRRSIRRTRSACSPRRATPSGAALGPISFIANGGGYDGAIVAMLEENLGVDIEYATMDFGSYQDRLATDPPELWSLSWVADYPGPNDFLGVLLGTGSTANEGGWSNAAFDAAIAEAGAAASADEATSAYARALGVVRDEAPGGARLVRDLVLARPRRAAGRQPERARDPPPRGPRVGGGAVSAPPAPRPSCALLAIGALVAGLLVPAPGARGRRHLRHARSSRRPSTSPSTSRSTSRAPRPSRAPSCASASRARSARSSWTCPSTQDTHADAALPARPHGERPPRPQHADHGDLGGVHRGGRGARAERRAGRPATGTRPRTGGRSRATS